MFGSPSYKNPADSAMPYLQKIPGLITPYYQPYIDTGNQAMSQFFNQVSQLGTPTGATDIYNQLASGYSTSPGAQYSMDQATKQTNQLAAASGMFGTPSEQAALASEIEGISSKDFNQYMDQMFSLYSTGLHGEEGLTKLGYGASSELASDLAKNLMSEAGLEFAGTQGENKYNAANSNALYQMIGSILGGAAGIGTSLIKK